jgi:hypothetical protein
VGSPLHSPCETRLTQASPTRTSAMASGSDRKHEPSEGNEAEREEPAPGLSRLLLVLAPFLFLLAFFFLDRAIRG